MKGRFISIGIGGASAALLPMTPTLAQVTYPVPTLTVWRAHDAIDLSTFDAETDPQEAGVLTSRELQPDEIPDPTDLDETAEPSEPERINPFGRTLRIPVPFRLGSLDLGTIQLEISPEDELSLERAELLVLIEDEIDPANLERLGLAPDQTGAISFDEIRSRGLNIDYDQREIAVILSVPSTLRPEQSIAITPQPERRRDGFLEPARTSAYLNVRGTLGYDAAGVNSGFTDPLFDLSGAIRARDIVLEADFSLDASGGDNAFNRAFTRAVYDIPEANLRLSALDVFPFATSFLPAPNVLGVSLERRRELFNPQSLLRSDTTRAFQLQESAVVEVIINGSEVRRLQLDPGNYRLTDFPFASGANDVQIIATDNFGRREVANFDQFYNFSFLQKGETELGLTAGFLDQFSLEGGRYDFDRPAFVGFYRRGMSETLTLGGAVQGDTETQNAAVEATLGGRLGIFVLEGAVSQDTELGSGVSGRVLWQLPPASATSFFAGLGATFDYSSANFTTTGRFSRNRNPLVFTASTNVAFRASDEDFFTLNTFYSHFRDGLEDTYEISGRYNRRIGRSLLMTFAAGYGRNRFNGEQPFFRITLSRRFGRRGFGQLAYNSRDDRYRAAYSYNDGIGTGAYNINAAVDGSGDDIAGSGAVFYLANNAELGVTHNSAFNLDQSSLATARTSLQFGTSFMVADGDFSIGRPVNDAFAVVDTHENLEDSDVFVDLNQDGDFFARSNGLGGAVVNDLGSYVERTVRVDVPDAPIGYDLGAGTFRVFPPYRAGYAIEVGSEFTVTALGTLLSGGRPVSLATGTARLPDEPEVQGKSLFTNRAGRFGISGLKPGRWVIEMNTTPRTRFEIVIPDNGETLIRLGEVESE
ncbi:MAG: hypothetical protein WBN07_14890 [Woeseiaceae bacterium]